MSIFNMSCRDLWKLSREPAVKKVPLRDIVKCKIPLSEIIEDEKKACEFGETPLTYLNWYFTIYLDECSSFSAQSSMWIDKFFKCYAKFVWAVNEFIFVPIDGVYLLLLRPFFKLLDAALRSRSTAVMEYIIKYCTPFGGIMFWGSLFVGCVFLQTMLKIIGCLFVLGLKHLGMN